MVNELLSVYLTHLLACLWLLPGSAEGLRLRSFVSARVPGRGISYVMSSSGMIVTLIYGWWCSDRLAVAQVE